jgi:hypothetical protein
MSAENAKKLKIGIGNTMESWQQKTTAFVKNAMADKKLIRLEYGNYMFFPDELLDQFQKGKMMFSIGNWSIVDPLDYVEDLKSIAEKAKFELDSTVRKLEEEKFI